VTRRALLLLALCGAGLTATRSAAQTPSTAQAPAAGAERVVGSPRGQALSGPALEARTQELASLLRCPVCQGLSVADSPATTARLMKAEVRQMLAAGYDQDQILVYFERSYGEFVRLKPPLRGVNWLVWGAPILGFLAGSSLVVWTLRARRSEKPPAAEAIAKPGDATLPGHDTLPDDPRLAALVLKVRELAYGWPGGIAPPQARS
jgi:cytochrome c-type biogenesis protein CcmH